MSLTAYCMKTKQKNVPMQNATITRTKRNGYCAQGTDENGNKMASILSEAKAMEAIEKGWATKGF